VDSFFFTCLFKNCINPIGGIKKKFIIIKATNTMRYSPRVNYVFERLFFSKENKKFLESFVNAVLSPKKQLSEITLVYPNEDKDTESDTFHIPYITGIDEKGYHYTVEMEIVYKVDYSNLILSEWSKFSNKGLKESNESDLFRGKIKIYVMNFDSFEQQEDYHHVFDILSGGLDRSYRDALKSADERLELHFIELEKFSKSKKSIYEPRNKELYKWTNFLATVDKYERNSLPELFKSDPDLKEAFEALEGLDLNQKEEEIYESQLKLLQDGRNEVQTDYHRYWQKILIHLLFHNFGYISSEFLSVTNELDDDLLGDIIDRVTAGKVLDMLVYYGMEKIKERNDE
jgi:predicted transposase/invertase (TIGR01784 family)